MLLEDRDPILRQMTMSSIHQDLDDVTHQHPMSAEDDVMMTTLEAAARSPPPSRAPYMRAEAENSTRQAASMILDRPGAMTSPREEPVYTSSPPFFSLFSPLLSLLVFLFILMRASEPEQTGPHMYPTRAVVSIAQQQQQHANRHEHDSEPVSELELEGDSIAHVPSSGHVVLTTPTKKRTLFQRLKGSSSKKKKEKKKQRNNSSSSLSVSVLGEERQKEEEKKKKTPTKKDKSKKTKTKSSEPKRGFFRVSLSKMHLFFDLFFLFTFLSYIDFSVWFSAFHKVSVFALIFLNLLAVHTYI